jgi:nucleotide-binding universal stress UspA family protein
MRILAATDGSRHAQAAVRFAAWLASSFRGGRLDIVLVGDVGPGLIAQGGGGASRVRSAVEEDYRRWAGTSLDRAAREALRLRVKARCHYVEASLAPVAGVVSRTADVLRADLIVVGSAGRGAVGRAVFGSVARRLAQTARRPVVVVPASVAARRGDPLRILAATDGSRGATLAIRAAASLASRARRGSLDVLTVGTLRRDLAIGFSSVVLSMLPYRELQESERHAADRILRRAGAAARSAGMRPKLRFLEPRAARPVAELIAAEARRSRAHLVAVGTEGHGAMEAWVIGSVTSRLLAVSRRPVLVIRPARRSR